MKFNVSSSELLANLLAVSKVILAKNPMSIFDNFLLRIEDNRLYIKGSDQENVMMASMEITEVEGSGAVALNAKKLLDMLKAVPNMGLTFYINDETRETEIRFLNGRGSFIGEDAAQYPESEGLSGEVFTTVMPAEVILKALDCTLFAVSNDTSRPSLTGIFWDLHPDDVTFVSTDTHKMVKFVSREVHPGSDHSFIMPAKPAAILKGVLAKDSTDVKVSVDGKSIRFEWDCFELDCRRILNNYHNYNRIIPQNNPFVITVNRESLLASLRRVAIFASVASSQVIINLQPNEMIISGQDADYATSAEEKLQCDYSGNTMTIGFNVQYLIEVIANTKCDTVVMRLSDPARPGLVEPGDPVENEELQVLIMPMRISDGM